MCPFKVTSTINAYLEGVTFRLFWPFETFQGLLYQQRHISAILQNFAISMIR